jgi:hypothetical protein
MIFILTESIMNGTVTMNIITTGIDADSFMDAKKKVKNLPNFYKATILKETEQELYFSLQDILGFINYEPLKIL